MKLFLKIFEWIIFIVIICAIAVIASPFLLYKQNVSSYDVVSGSMVPTINIGTLTFVRQTPFNTLQKGDIIAFTDPTDNNRVILHRIYSVTQTSSGRTLQTKGDHNRFPDGWRVTSVMVKGRLFYMIPYIGNLSEWLKTPLGFGIMVGIPALIFLFLSILQIRKGIKEEIEKGIAKNENKNSSSTHTVSMLIAPFLVIVFVLSFFPPIYAIKFGHTSVAFSVSTAVPSPTPTVAPTNGPMPTPIKHPHPTGTPTPTPSCSGDTNINVSGNGAGSNNNVNVNNNCSTTIIQTNNTNTSTTINSTVNTGNNTVSNNTDTGLTLITGNASSIISVTTQSSSNSASISH